MPEITLYCLRVCDEDSPVQGSTKLKCTACGEDVWISPASKQSMAGFPDDFKVRIMCNRCGDSGPG